MPRTKISKSSKRNREAAQREEKIREFDQYVDEINNMLDAIGQDCIKDMESDFTQIVRRVNKKLLQMSMENYLLLDLVKFADWTAPLACAPSTLNASELGRSNSSSRSIYNSSTMRSAKTSNPNDEGYLTEDSTTGGSSAGSLAALTGVSQLQLQQQQRGRTPGPFSSARARRPRRSKSVCGDYIPGSAVKQKPVVPTTDHTSRSKLRTPQAPRTKAFSADRSMAKSCADSPPSSPPTAFMRWPKPGEMVLSMCGSPVVAQVLPDKFANVNIPVRNGVLSLRPKKLAELKPELIESIDPDTLNQIRTLQASLNLIINTADKANLN